MSSLISQWWAQLEGSVHPEDKKVFDAAPEHTFNFDFPPPAFIGAVDTAPIVVLMCNGGYKQGVTDAEFPDEKSKSEFRGYLRGEIHKLPATLAKYYVTGPFANWISDGTAVLVNAVPYRSPRLSDEPVNQNVARQLPSLKTHQEEVLPDAARERRFVFVHRNRWWQVAHQAAGPCVLFSDPRRAEPNRLAPDQEKLDLARSWLSSCR